MKKLTFILSLLLFPNISFGLEIANSSIFLKQSGNEGQKIDFKFDVTNISTSDLGEKPAIEDTLRALLIEKFTVCYQSTDCSTSSSQRIPYSESGQTADPSTTLDGYIEISSITFGEDPNNSERYRGAASYVLTLNEGQAFKADESITFVYGDGRVQEAKIQKYTSVIDDPKGLALLSQNKGLVISWETVSTVTYAQTNNKAAPVGMRSYLIPLNLLDENDSITFKSVMTGYNAEEASPTETTYDCELTVNKDESTCRFICNNPSSAYLTPSIFEKSYASVRIKSQDSSTANTISYPGLDDIAQEYAAIIQYLPDGLRSPSFSQCVYGNPIETFSYAQISGAGEASPGDPRCFIATAAYGSPIGEELNQLRWFRDQILLSNSYGRLFVEKYYKYSPTIAQWIEKNDFAKAAVRTTLRPIVGLVKILRKHQENNTKL